MTDRREYHRLWKARKYASDPEPMRQAMRDYRARNRDRINAARAQNPEPRRLQRKQRYASDEAYRLTNILRATLRNALLYRTRPNWRPGARIAQLLGCSKHTLLAHIEARFLPGMSWENYGRGGWEIDHVTPCASFDLTDAAQQAACFHYMNLRPLWRNDNQRKGSKEP